MYISVIPLRHSLSQRPYTYFVAEVWRDAIVIGGLVEVPIGKHMTEAIVASKDTPLPENISVEDVRAIIRVTASIEIVAPYMISMILEIAGRYLLLIHKVASLFLPAPLLSRLDKKNYILAINEFWKQERGSKCKNPKIEHYIDSIFSKGDLTKYMIPGSVFIFPDDIFLSLFSQGLEGRTDIGVFPTDLTPAKRVRSWIETYEQKYDIIFGTRRILYYNLRSYTQVIYVEDAFATEQYSYPTRIQNLDVLRSLIHGHIHEVTLISSTPSLMALSYFQGADIISIRA